MTVYTASFAGVNGAALNPAQFTSYEAGSGTVRIQSNRARLTTNPTEYGAGAAVLWIQPPNLLDSELYGSCPTVARQAGFVLAALRTDGTTPSGSFPAKGYWLELDHMQGLVQVWRSDGSEDVRLGDPFPVTPGGLISNAMYWYRFRLEGARVRVKVWTAEEPLGWQINLVDPDPYLVAGRPFWSVQTSVASALYYDLASAVLYDSTSWLSGNVALQPTLVEHPFVITVFDKAFTRQGWVSNPVYCTFTPRFNAMGTGEIQVAADDPIVEALSDEGARIRVEYRDAHLLSGPVRAIQGEFVAGGTVTYQVEEDWRELDNLAWVRPGNVITPTELTATAPGWLAQTTLPGGGGDAGADGTTQGQYEYFFWPDGSAAAGGVLVSYSESAIKLLISANSVTRLGRPLTVATDLARGGDARAADELPEVRFSTIAEGIAPILEWSGLGLKLWHDGVTPTIHVDVFEPGEWLQELTVESGIIANGTWSLSYPEATRAVVGGPGEGPARAFSEVITALGFETTYNDVREVFTDATGFKLVWPDALADELRVAKGFLLQPTVPSIRKTRFTNYLARAGRAAIVEGKPTGGVSIELSETESFYFGGAEGVQLGDTVTAVSGGQRFTDRITEASLSWDATDGLTVTPRVGVRDDDPNKAFVAALRRVADSLSRQSKAK